MATSMDRFYAAGGYTAGQQGILDAQELETRANQLRQMRDMERERLETAATLRRQGGIQTQDVNLPTPTQVQRPPAGVNVPVSGAQTFPLPADPEIIASDILPAGVSVPVDSLTDDELAAPVSTEQASSTLAEMRQNFADDPSVYTAATSLGMGIAAVGGYTTRKSLGLLEYQLEAAARVLGGRKNQKRVQDLFDRYRSGEASQEEVAAINAEVEKLQEEEMTSPSQVLGAGKTFKDKVGIALDEGAAPADVLQLARTTEQRNIVTEELKRRGEQLLPLGGVVDPASTSVVDQIIVDPEQAPKLNAVAYRQAPEMISRDLQRVQSAMEQTQMLANVALRNNNTAAFLQYQDQYNQLVESAYYVQGMQGLQDLAYGNGDRLAAVLTHYTGGWEHQIINRGDGTFDMLVNGEPIGRPLSSSELATYAQQRFDKEFAAALAQHRKERDDAMFETQQEYEFWYQKERIKAVYDIQQRVLQNELDTARALATDNKMQLVETTEGVFLVTQSGRSFNVNRFQPEIEATNPRFGGSTPYIDPQFTSIALPGGDVGLDQYQALRTWNE